MKLWNIWYQAAPNGCVYKTQVLFQKAQVILGENIVWLASHSDLLNLSIISYVDESSVNKTDDSFLLLKHIYSSSNKQKIYNMLVYRLYKNK